LLHASFSLGGVLLSYYTVPLRCVTSAPAARCGYQVHRDPLRPHTAACPGTQGGRAKQGAGTPARVPGDGYRPDRHVTSAAAPSPSRVRREPSTPSLYAAIQFYHGWRDAVVPLRARKALTFASSLPARTAVARTRRAFPTQRCAGWHYACGLRRILLNISINCFAGCALPPAPWRTRYRNLPRGFSMDSTQRAATGFLMPNNGCGRERHWYRTFAPTALPRARVT